jgi:uncharacterized protein
MLNQWAKALVLTGALCGLCASANANTTGPEATPAGQPVRIALLLPTHSSALGAAADVVRAGFMAAFERENQGVAVTLVQTGDAPQEVLSGYATASALHDIVVGPLSRSGVTAVAQKGAVSKPTLALTAPDNAETPLPVQMLVMGLSVEDEARQVAHWASLDKSAAKALVVSTRTLWQKRAAKAFIAQWKHLGFEADAVEIDAADGYLNGRSLQQLKKTIQADQPVLLFAALDAWQARQLRETLGSQIPFYGTSQLNPIALADRTTAEPVEEMNGARLLDIPWQLQTDHPAVMVYPRLVVAADQKRSADMERLYALGIDAFRVAREIAMRHTDFELDGVTGKLSVRLDGISARFERTAQQAIYRDGAVVTDKEAQAQ